MTTFYVKVTPDADTFTIDLSGTYPRIAVPAPAEQGRANATLVAHLEEVLGEEVRIVSGHHSRRKKIAVEMPEKSVFNRLNAASSTSS